MAKVIVMNGVSVDGVMQSPARPDEDTRDGFSLGGWAVSYSDQAAVAEVGRRLAQRTGGQHEWLLGRRSYEEMLAVWNARGGPFKEGLNNARKHVASSNPETRLQWPNSTLLSGDVPAAVAELKQTSSTDLVIMGSGVLIGSLIAADVIDEYLLSIAPVVLGQGRRLFAGGTYATLRLVHSSTTSKGVVIALYERDR